MKAAWKIALEALEYHTAQTRPIHQTNEAITAIKEALAQDSKRPIESDYISQVAYTRALEKYCDALAQPEQPAPVIQKSCKQCDYQHHYETMTGPCGPCRFYSNFAAAPQPIPVQQGILARKWILHGGFADVASFDADGFPSFYWKESVAKFKAGELSAPCKGKNCGSLNGWLHSAECLAEHEAHYAAPQPEQEPVAWGMQNDGGQIYDCITPMEHLRIEGEYTVPLYASPPRRTWVGLTDEDIERGANSSWVDRQAFESAVWWAEAKLKELNT